jgi:hypothetical protein
MMDKNRSVSRSCFFILLYVAIFATSGVYAQTGQSDWQLPEGSKAKLGQSDWQVPADSSLPDAKSNWQLPSPAQLGTSDWQLPSDSSVHTPEFKRGKAEQGNRNKKSEKPSLPVQLETQPQDKGSRLGQSDWINPGNNQELSPGQPSTNSQPALPTTKLLGEVLEQEEGFGQGIPMNQPMMVGQGMMPMNQPMMMGQGMMPMNQPMMVGDQNPLAMGAQALNLLMNVMPGNNGAVNNFGLTMPSLGVGGFQSHLGGGGRPYRRMRRPSVLGDIGDVAGFAARQAIRRGMYNGMYRIGF